MQKTESGDFLISREELSVLRAGLFVAIYHFDTEFGEELQTVSGYDVEEFESMLRTVDRSIVS